MSIKVGGKKMNLDIERAKQDYEYWDRRLKILFYEGSVKIKKQKELLAKSGGVKNSVILDLEKEIALDDNEFRKVKAKVLDLDNILYMSGVKDKVETDAELNARLFDYLFKERI
jgi:hypothetical protein